MVIAYIDTELRAHWAIALCSDVNASGLLKSKLIGRKQYHKQAAFCPLDWQGNFKSPTPQIFKFCTKLAFFQANLPLYRWDYNAVCILANTVTEHRTCCNFFFSAIACIVLLGIFKFWKSYLQQEACQLVWPKFLTFSKRKREKKT